MAAQSTIIWKYKGGNVYALPMQRVSLPKHVMNSEARTFQFQRSCTIAEAEFIREMLHGHLAESEQDTIRLDLSAVEEADITLLQILISAEKSAQAKGAALRIASSATVDALLGQAGLPGWPQAEAA